MAIVVVVMGVVESVVGAVDTLGAEEVLLGRFVLGCEHSQARSRDHLHPLQEEAAAPALELLRSLQSLPLPEDSQRLKGQDIPVEDFAHGLSASLLTVLRWTSRPQRLKAPVRGRTFPAGPRDQPP